MSTLPETMISDLSAEERLSLIAALWDSLTDEQTPLSEAQRAELERRLSSFELDRNSATSWDNLKAELRSRSS